MKWDWEIGPLTQCDHQGAMLQKNRPRCVTLVKFLGLFACLFGGGKAQPQPGMTTGLQCLLQVALDELSPHVVWVSISLPQSRAWAHSLRGTT